MKLDRNLRGSYEAAVPEAKAAEVAGYDGIWAPEAAHDPFLPMLLAAEHTTRIEVATGIAVAFARNPMTLAQLGYDLQRFSHGRFILGLGSQIKPHIERRFSMPWSHPAARMSELISAIKHIWSSWETGEKLDFRGEFYQHTLMPPFFDPGPNPYGRAKIFLAAVGERMTEVAGTVADGMLAHAFVTERFLREVTLPAIDRGLAAGGRTRADFELSTPTFVVSGRDEDEMAVAVRGTKAQIAFYGSTPSYQAVLDLHGWGELHEELNAMSKRGEWQRMTDAVPDEVLHAMAVVGEPEDIAGHLLKRCGDYAARLSFYAPYKSHPETWERVVAGMRRADGDIA